METPILSIVVPTKNRYRTLRVLIEAILNWKAQDFELIIQDNSVNNSEILESIVGFRTDKRLKYFYEPKSLTLVENCELAIEKTNGEYICFIGDDDGLVEETTEICKWLKANEIESASFRKASYLWPDVEERLKGNSSLTGILHIPLAKGKVQLVDSKKSLIKTLKRKGAQHDYRNPAPYHGIVSKQCYLRLKRNAGRFFPGPTPDMSSAVGISLNVNKHVFIDWPLIISGTSLLSAGGMGMLGEHIGELENVTSLPRETSDNWTPELPFYWSGPTINAESAIKALEGTNNKDLIKYVNFNRIYALCLMYIPSFRKRTILHVMELKRSRNPKVSYSKIFIEFMLISAERSNTLFTKVQHCILGHFNDRNRIHCRDIGEAMVVLQTYVRNTGVLDSVITEKIEI